MEIHMACTWHSLNLWQVVTVEETTDPASPSLRGLVSDVVSPSSSGWTYGKIGWWMRYRWFFRFLVWQTCTPCSCCQHVSQKKSKTYFSEFLWFLLYPFLVFFRVPPQKMGHIDAVNAARSLRKYRGGTPWSRGWMSGRFMMHKNGKVWWVMTRGGGRFWGGWGCSWMVWTGNCQLPWICSWE